MQTKLSVLCDKIIEAGWLLALVVVPLFFNVYSSRVFEPDKLALLRTIALVMALAWVAKWAEGAPWQAPVEGSKASGSWLRRLKSTPLVLPALALTLVYLLTTITSVVPRISFWGSYQRLQGTYTTLSYLVIFFALLGHLRRPEQLRRIWMTIILTSLPISLYGLVQHYGLDPLPWGGDVTFRVAANMGNAIFIGAYLIMAIPLTLARILQLQREAIQEERSGIRLGFTLGFWVLLAAQTWSWAALRFERGLPAGLLMLVMLALVGVWLRRPLGRFLLLGAYGLILSVQITCLFFTQSRGPLLGFLAGLVFFGLLYLLTRGWRRITALLVAVAALALCLLVIINLPGSPLAAVRKVPYIGRLGRILELNSGTGKVRVLIWEGALEMLKAQPLRALIGYGPEAMYVAYNPYYPPELAHYEARNASPDRSHNETFDALVMTGAIGFLVYMALFVAVFYHGLRYVGLVRGPTDRRLFGCLGAAGALLGVVLPWTLDGSLRLAGVGLPLGLVAGITLYVVIVALRGGAATKVEQFAEAAPSLTGWRQLLFIALLAAIVAHFVEIHFGIAIAATRTYFWTYAALLVALGQGWVEAPGILASEESVGLQTQPGGRRRRSTGHTRARNVRSQDLQSGSYPQESEAPNTQVEALALVVASIAITLFWNYTTNPLGQSNPLAVLATAFTTMAAKNQPHVTSMGLLALVLTSLAAATVATIAEVAQRRAPGADGFWWLTALGRVALLCGVGSLIFALVHTGGLGPGANIVGLIYTYYVAIALVWAILALMLYRSAAKASRFARGPWAWAYAIGLVVCLVMIENTNIATVRADVLYKQGLKYDNQGAWDSAIYYYREAIALAPHEDFYYLFSGRALMEKAKEEGGAQMRQAYLEASRDALLRARELNPLNTDHTANLGRLYRTWAELESDPAARRQKMEQSAAYYQQALLLSPNNAQIHNESGLIYFLLGDREQAMASYERSLALDRQFMQTYILMGDVYLEEQNWAAAVSVYEKALALDPSFVQGWSALGYAYSQMGALDEAIRANLQVLVRLGEDYSTFKNLAILYRESGNVEQAVAYAERALRLAPEAERPVVQAFIAEASAGSGGGGP
ncbi:MAG: tetratricopeptide repeat protein [Anaerolineae bacterium]|nr:tetratricopeptide repeat protein [Anaerolineae bacterium]